MRRAGGVIATMVCCVATAAAQGGAVAGEKEAPAPQATESAAKAPNVPDLRRKLEIARHKAARARLDLQVREAKRGRDREHAARELELAQGRLRQFEEVDAPSRLAEAELELQEARDRAQEAADELAQIELMYQEQDLDDRTAEFVVKRGRRGAERARARIVLREQRLAALKDHVLALERGGLALDVDKKQAALDALGLESESELLKKRIDILEAEAEEARLTEELAKVAPADSESP